jgi:hypothetical protein
VRHADGRMVCGPRHLDGIMWAQILGMTYEDFARLQRLNALPPLPDEAKGWAKAEQGFIDQFGTFLTREEAAKIVGKPSGVLYSEDLY